MKLVRTAMLLAFMTALFMAIGYLIGGGTGMIFALLIACAMNFLSYWNGDKMVLRMNQAVEVGPENAPEFHEIVRRLAEAAQLPMPRTYLINSPQPNAFATGRNPEHAAVAATTGLLEMLAPEEVAGVMAHELAHIANRDTLTMTITATLAGAISMLGNFAFYIGRGRNTNNPVGAIGTLMAIIVAPIAAMMVQMAISRTREYSADRTGAGISGKPLWLASALGKIAEASGRIPNRWAEANPAIAHMYIINPLGQHARDSLFSTHPDPANRISALQEMAREMEAPLPPEAPEAASAQENPDVAAGPWEQPAANGEKKPRNTRKWGRQEEDPESGGDMPGGPWN